ncbi:MAG: PA14 domain-containing protein [Kiritimatiellia bacterium]
MMKNSLLCMGVVAFAAATWGEVQNVTITAANAHAYSAANRLVCDSGSRISVQYSYKLNGETMKAALLDFIEVTPPAEGAPEPWVSISLSGGGLTNDVDFSEQPYLWLGAPGDSDRHYLNGLYEPYGDVYRFGYAGGTNGELSGLVVTNLVDNPRTGAPRRVLVRGDGDMTFMAPGCSYTGGMVVEGPAWIDVGGDDCFGVGAKANPKDFVTLRNVGGKPARINFKNANMSYATGFRIEGTNIFHSCGASDRAVCTVFNGPITGEGGIRLTDQGGVRFTSPENTFTGSLEMVSGHDKFDIEIGFGNGKTCSWAGDRIVQLSSAGNKALTNNIVVVNCDEDFTLATTLSATGGRLVKKGPGTLTLGQAFPRRPITGRPDVPVMQIQGGTVKRTAPEPTAPSGVIEIAVGATLDLNRVPAASVWLPYGGGSIVNPAESTVTFQGATRAGASAFNGFVDGRGVLNEATEVPWRLGSQARFAGGLEITAGDVEVEDGFESPGLALTSFSTVSVLPYRSLTTGLKLEAWFSSSAWTGSNHAGKMATARAYAEEHDPGFVGDMAAFGETFYTGSGDADGGGRNGAFCKTFGSTRDHFVAKFTGYVEIEADGLYGFRAAADDAACIILDGTNTVATVAEGSHNVWGTAENVPLTAGRHPITIWFLEETGWEILWVQMKALGGEWEHLPIRLLSTWDGRHADLGAVTGTGAIALGEAGVEWPRMDLTGFTGRLVAGDATAAESAGFVAPVSAALHFPGVDSDWWHAGLASIVVDDGGMTFDLGGRESSNNCLNRRAPLDVTKPFEVSFDFSIHEPWGDNPGDGFCLALHDKETGTYGGTFSYDEKGNRINNAGAYGLQAYLMPTANRICWVKDNHQLGTVTSNSVYVMNNARDRAKPFHVTMTWDLEKLVCTFAQEGREPLVFTNTTAKDDLAEKFPSGQAYLGLWARNGGYYCTMRFEKVRVAGAAEPEAPRPMTFNGVLGIAGGVAQVVASHDVAPVIASDLSVTGAGGLRAPADVGTRLTGETWTFDLANPAAKLTLTGPFAFPAGAVVTVELNGEPQPRARVLADLTGIPAEALAGVTFRLAEGCPRSWRLALEGGLLKVSVSRGTTVFIR